ncbi:MAG: sensor histidine kinase [Candidatus Bipolaricaulia bacterium]
MGFFERSTREQVALLRRALPVAILILVLGYQLYFVRHIHELGTTYHYLVEIAFYGLAGPAVTWGVLAWIERQLYSKERAEERAERERERRERAVGDERARIAREIHEGVAQNLYFLGLQLDVAKKLAHDHPERVEAELVELRSLLSESIADLRRLIWALRPIELEELGPIEAIRRLSADLENKVDLDVEVSVQGPERRFDPELEGTLYRLVQESLNNVAKHADAEHAWVTFVLNDGQVEASIGDDGRGFDADAAIHNGDGLGLRHLRERVENLGGSFTVDSSEEGTRVTAALPLDTGQSEEPPQ